MLLVRAVREIDAGDIETGIHERADGLRRVTGRTERAHDLRAGDVRALEVCGHGVVIGRG